MAPMVQVGWACLKGAHEHSVQARNTSGRWKTAACHGAACRRYCCAGQAGGAGWLVAVIQDWEREAGGLIWRGTANKGSLTRSDALARLRGFGGPSGKRVHAGMAGRAASLGHHPTLDMDKRACVGRSRG